MYAPVKTTGYRRALLAKVLLLVSAAISVTALAIGVVKAQTTMPRAGATPMPTPSVRILGAHQMRCWQYGRLVLEEWLAQQPSDASVQSITLQGGHGAGVGYTLFNLGPTTCLVKPANER